MPIDMESFKKQMINRYNRIKQDLIDMLSTPDEESKENKPEELMSKGLPLKEVLQKMRIPESALREALTNAKVGLKIDIYSAAKEGSKEELWVKISDKQ